MSVRTIPSASAEKVTNGRYLLEFLDAVELERDWKTRLAIAKLGSKHESKAGIVEIINSFTTSDISEGKPPFRYADAAEAYREGSAVIDKLEAIGFAIRTTIPAFGNSTELAAKLTPKGSQLYLDIVRAELRAMLITEDPRGWLMVSMSTEELRSEVRRLTAREDNIVDISAIDALREIFAELHRRKP